MMSSEVIDIAFAKRMEHGYASGASLFWMNSPFTP